MFINQMVPKRVLFLVPNKIDDSDAAFFMKYNYVHKWYMHHYDFDFLIWGFCEVSGKHWSNGVFRKFYLYQYESKQVVVYVQFKF